MTFHKRTLTRLVLATACFLGTSTSAPVAAATGEKSVDGNAILAELDRRAEAFDDQQYAASMQIIKGGEVRKTLRFNATMKGLHRQLLVFTAPGDVAGMKVLMVDAHTLYLYSKEFNKVRKVAAHAVKQGFMGSDFTFEDMTQTKLGVWYDAALNGKQGSITTLTLTAKPDYDLAYKKLEVDIDATEGAVTHIRYFDGAGALVREQERRDFKTIADKRIPTVVEMKDLKSNNATVITMTDIKVNQSVDESLFTRRQLLRG